MLITYADSIRGEGEVPLQSLKNFLDEYLADVCGRVHILPFFPSSSDDGFAVIDYRMVDHHVGSWQDIEALAFDFDVMFDLVINHCSRESLWFADFVSGREPGKNYFITLPEESDTSAVARPRSTPLITAIHTYGGIRHVWNTFSDDQIDLDFSNPDVLCEFIDILFFYIARGAHLIRLDAVGYLWKRLGSSCLNLTEAHTVVRLLRVLVEEAAPEVKLITETNVPHEQNVSYFGDGTNEAQMVYNFSLPPLTLHAFHTGNATLLSNWASNLRLPSDQVTFFNFLSSHDGIGVTPAKGLLTEDEILSMANRVQALGGEVSYKTNHDGTQSPYELNINYMDALGDPSKKETTRDISARFLASQAIMLTLQGVPGIYFHSLFGSENWIDGIAETGQKRSINREKLRYV
ncbi:MAG: alpha-amylase family glycosyl hydrolase, partial [Pseudomonadota bacterium]